MFYTVLYFHETQFLQLGCMGRCLTAVEELHNSTRIKFTIKPTSVGAMMVALLGNLWFLSGRFVSGVIFPFSNDGFSGAWWNILGLGFFLSCSFDLYISTTLFTLTCLNSSLVFMLFFLLSFFRVHWAGIKSGSNQNRCTFFILGSFDSSIAFSVSFLTKYVASEHNDWLMSWLQKKVGVI